MFQLDDNFLNDVGLGGLPDDQKQAFLQHIYEELELRVGTKLSEGLSEDQMGEFESFIDAGSAGGDDERIRQEAENKVRAWYDKHLADYASHQDFVQLRDSAPAGTSDITIMCEYGSLKWLELNRPDYRQVVAAELEALKKEIAASAPTILGSADQTGSA